MRRGGNTLFFGRAEKLRVQVITPLLDLPMLSLRLQLGLQPLFLLRQVHCASFQYLAFVYLACVASK